MIIVAFAYQYIKLFNFMSKTSLFLTVSLFGD